MAVNYEDELLAQVESDKQEAISEYTELTDQMIANTDGQYQQLIDATQQWGDKQAQIQQEQTDFTIEQIEQQKAKAEKDYTKEQSGAYVDWQKQSNQYGAGAEKMATSGLAGTGFSESSQVAMYNTYQNRVATAREVYNRAVLDYDNSIKEARLQNNSILAEIAFNTLQTRLELSLEGFQYKNQLLLDRANKKIEIDNMFFNRYLGVLDQINTEKALAENIRQFDKSFGLKEKEYLEGIRQFNEDIELERDKLDEEIRQFDETQKGKGGSIGGGNSGSIGGDDSGEKGGAIIDPGKDKPRERPTSLPGYGQFKDSGSTVQVGDTTYKIWKTSDGSLWYWDEKNGKYVQLKRAQPGGVGGGGRIFKTTR